MAAVCSAARLLAARPRRSLLLLFGTFGFPSHQAGDVQATSYIFNGDFVDRGVHQLEAV